MSLNSTMAYRTPYRSSYSPASSSSSYKPYRSTYSTDYASQRTTMPIYKTSSYVSGSTSRTPSYITTSRTLPTLPRTGMTTYDQRSSSRTLPLRAGHTPSYETSRSNFERATYNYTSSRRDSDRFSSARSSQLNRNVGGTSSISSGSMESSRSVVRRTDSSDKENTDSPALTGIRRSSNVTDRTSVKQLGGNPSEVIAEDNDNDTRTLASDGHSFRRSPSVDRTSKDTVSSARSKRFQSVDRVGPAKFSILTSLNANTDKGCTGLRNLGNTCFMNSVLQCLSNTQPLLEFCLSSSDHESEINRSTSRMKGDLVTSFVKLMQSMWTGHDYVSPTDFKSEVSRFARRFGGYNQQDAQEFLISLLEGLQDDLNRVQDRNKKRHIDCTTEVETISASDKARESWKKYLEYENSKIVDIFVGQLKSALTCLECGYVSNTFDPFFDLSLPIPKGRSSSAVSLSDCFELFTQEETLEGDERPTCARCKKRQKCTKRLSIQKFPQIIIIHLKRFSQDSLFRSKLSTEVKCPTKNLDLKKFSAEKSAGSVTYNLYAVSNHSGTPAGGHYTASAKNPYTSQWHYFNDQRVSALSEAGAVSSEAYILFYELSMST